MLNKEFLSPFPLKNSSLNKRNKAEGRCKEAKVGIKVKKGRKSGRFKKNQGNKIFIEKIGDQQQFRLLKKAHSVKQLKRLPIANSNTNQDILYLIRHLKQNKVRNSKFGKLGYKKLIFPEKNKNFLEILNFVKNYKKRMKIGKIGQIKRGMRYSTKKPLNSPQPRLSSKGSRKILSLNPMLDREENDFNKIMMIEQNLGRKTTSKRFIEKSNLKTQILRNFCKKPSCKKKLDFSAFQKIIQNQSLMHRTGNPFKNTSSKPKTSIPRRSRNHSNNTNDSQLHINYINNNILLNFVSPIKYNKKYPNSEFGKFFQENT